MVKCEEMKKKSPIDVKFYSEDCDEMKNDYGYFSDVEQKTLKRLVKSSDKYWCNLEKGIEDCHFYVGTKKNRGEPSFSVKVCAVESFARGRENTVAQSVVLEPDNRFGLSNSPDGSYRDIRISLAKVEGLEKQGEEVAFNTKKPLSKTVAKSSMSEVFNHEVGHSIFSLAHPKSHEVDSIMHSGKREEDIGTDYKTTCKDDRKFIKKCLRRRDKSKDDTREL